jgi:HSP20 family protein
LLSAVFRRHSESADTRFGHFAVAKRGALALTQRRPAASVETDCAVRAQCPCRNRPRHRSKTMNELRVHDPFAIEPMDEMFRHMLRPWRTELAERAPQIKLDVHENDASYTIKAEVPGVNKDDIDVRIEGNRVTLSAELKKDKEEKKDGRLLRSERQYGYVSRSFTLACDVDEAKSEAKYKDGVLELTLPKKTKTSSKRLPIA